MSVVTGLLFVALSVLLSLLWCNLVAAGDHLARRASARKLVSSEPAGDALV